MLSTHLKNIHDIFGQIPDNLESAWIAAAIGDVRKARETIAAVPWKHPFEAKYNQIASINWVEPTIDFPKSKMKHATKKFKSSTKK